MDLLALLIDFILHIDRHLLELFQQYGVWVYAILFLIIFCETGLVVTPFLPGDSLLFAAGALAAQGGLDVHLLALLLWIAGVLGDTANYAVGRYFGLRLFSNPDSKVFRRDYLDRTQRFYEKYGVRMIVLARFVPIVRTFAPFVAGMATMRYRTFLVWNVTGAAAWVALFTYVGYFFGNLPAIRENFTLVILGIVAISVMPMVVEFVRARREARAGPPS